MIAKSKVDIVLPCFNPGSSWHKELLSFYDLAKNKYDLNFVLVNDGSQVHTLEKQLAELQDANIPISYFHYTENKGKGFALRHGVEKSTAPYVVYTDVDFPFTNQSIVDLLDKLIQSNCDVVLGHRNNQYYQKKMSAFRKFLSRAFRVFLKSILHMPVTDTQCGLKGFNHVGKKAFLQTSINRYLFDFEFIYNICHNKQITFQTAEVQLKENVHFSKMRLKILLQETLNLMKVLVKSNNK